MKEKSTTELKDEKKQLISRSKAIIESAKGEKRQLNAEENEEIGANQCRMVEINLEIEEREAENRKTPARTYSPVGKEGKFSLRRAILAQANHQEQRDEEMRVIEEATKLHRSVAATAENCGDLIIPMETRAAFTAKTEAATGVVIDEDKMEMLLPLESNLVLAKAGARFMTGLTGNIVWPKYSGSNVSWEGENDAAKDGAGTFSKGTVYSPKRLTAYVDISKQLLIQENLSVESVIRQTLASAIAQKIEQTAFSKAAHTDNVPDGLFQTVPTITGAMDWSKIVELETSVDLQNALFGNLAYIMHPSLIGKAKTKVKDASGAGGFVFSGNGDGQLNGYRAFRTNNIPKDLQESADEAGIIFANWYDFFIGQWGAIDLTVDQYTQATKGMIRLVINSYWNMGKVREESFAIASMK